jgi:hypothetical protein
VLQARVPEAGRYRVSGRFCHAKDYGTATVTIGTAAATLAFRSSKLAWKDVALGILELPDEPFEIRVVAHGNTGDKGVLCHLGLDYLLFERISPKDPASAP